jgi:hypothetical protein
MEIISAKIAVQVLFLWEIKKSENIYQPGFFCLFIMELIFVRVCVSSCSLFVSCLIKLLFVKRYKTCYTHINDCISYQHT